MCSELAALEGSPRGGGWAFLVELLSKCSCSFTFIQLYQPQLQSSFTFCIQLRQRPPHEVLFLVVSSCSFPLLLQKILLSPPLRVVFPQSWGLQIAQALSKLNTHLNGYISFNTIKAPRKSEERIWVYHMALNFILWNTQLHPPEVSEALLAIVSLHLWYQRNMARLMPKIWNEEKKILIQNSLPERKPLISPWSLMQHTCVRLRCCCCWPVGCIIFRSAGNVLWLVCEFILLDFRLQIFGFGSAGTWTRPVTAFAIQLLLLWFVARRGGRVWVFSQLQKALISLLVLPVCEDLRGSAEGELHISSNRGIVSFFGGGNVLSFGIQSQSTDLGWKPDTT